MNLQVSLDKVYKPSEDVVAREVSGEFIIIPITSGVGDSQEEMFSLNEYGKIIWDKLSTHKSLRNVVFELSQEFEAPLEQIERDCVGLIQELLKRRIVVDKGNN